MITAEQPYVMTNCPDTSGQIAVDGDTFVCYACGQEFPTLTPCTGGDGRLRFANFSHWCVDGRDEAYCRACDEKMWIHYLEGAPPGGRVTLYMCRDEDGYYAAPFFGRPQFRCSNIRRSLTNWGHRRTDVEFRGPDGRKWHGRRQGENDVLRCRVCKKR